MSELKTTRVIFMGTPQFAVPTLSALIAHTNVVAVVTQPDAPSGRGNTLTPPPIKTLAQQHNLLVLQPPSLKPPEVVAQLRELKPDLIVVAAFGQILRRAVLELPPHGCINVHASLLPRWRGAAPIGAAIAAGDAETGVTIMQMDVGLDSGPMLSQARVLIQPSDTTGTLSEQLATLGAQLLIDTLPRWLNGSLSAQTQDESQVTTCRTLTKADGKIDWSRGAVEIERHVRAMQPWPQAWATWQGKPLKIHAAAVANAVSVNGTIGALTQIGKSRIGAQCGAGVLELVSIQPEGKKAMPAADFARGQRDFVGGVLDSTKTE